ncbi:MAG: hypothetical protein P1Q69_03680 [Candidatus Thorarchaeota archaeon]|nr:hypothetical protein [Candidatus Thorarchaeota archaeon]
MSKSKEGEKDEACPNTGREKRYCNCFDCTPGHFSFYGYFAGCRNIEEVSNRVDELQIYVEFLDTGSFEVAVW